MRDGGRRGGDRRPPPGRRGAPELVCPHFRPGEDLNCAIWSHRNATCSTWFCKHERGGQSATFWKRLRDMLAVIEARLSRWCALEVGLPDAALARLIATSNAAGERKLADQSAPSFCDAWIWADWLGREESYLLACAERVDSLGVSDVERICGADFGLDARLVRHGRATLDRPAALPAMMQLGDIEIGPPDADGFVVVRGYSGYDPLVLPSALLMPSAASRESRSRPGWRRSAHAASFWSSTSWPRWWTSRSSASSLVIRG